MSNKKSNGQKSLLGGLIWISSGFINIILTAALTGIIGGFVYLIYFGLAPATMMLTSFFMSGNSPSSEIPKSYGKAAFPVSIIVFLIGGFFTSFWAESFLVHQATFAGLGFFWGMVWYQLLQRGYISPDNF